MATKTLKQRANDIRKGLLELRSNEEVSEEKEMTVEKNVKDKEIIGPTEGRLGDRKRERVTDKSKTNVTIGDRKKTRE